MIVQVHLYSQSRPTIIYNALNTYTKDGLYCVLANENTVYKFPVVHIFRVIEEIGS